MPAIYQADTWCDSCGNAIRGQLRAEGCDVNEDDESSYDSDEFPKHMGDDEASDTPQHCASHAACLEVITLPGGTQIGALLSHSLTEDGVSYVRDYIRHDPGNEVVKFWRDEFAGYEME